MEQNENHHLERKDGLLSLAMKNVMRDDAGLYTLRCTNDSGFAESEAKLIVKGMLLTQKTTRMDQVPNLHKFYKLKDLWIDEQTNIQCRYLICN